MTGTELREYFCRRYRAALAESCRRIGRPAPTEAEAAAYADGVLAGWDRAHAEHGPDLWLRLCAGGSPASLAPVAA